jgi:hypothetical protein
VWAQPYASLTTYPVWWSLADLSAFYNSLEKFAGPESQCLPALLGNWNTLWTNASKAAGGPILTTVQLSACPPNDSFWKGLLIYVASVLAIYGAAYVAGAAAAGGAGSAGTVSEGVSAATTVAPDIGPIDTAVDLSVDTAAPVASSVAGSDTLAEITVTGTATGGGSLVPLAVASTAAPVIATEALDLSSANPNPNYADSSTPGSGLTPQQAISAASSANQLAKLLAAKGSATPALSVRAGTQVAPGSLTALTAGVPNYLWVMLALAGVYFVSA